MFWCLEECPCKVWRIPMVLTVFLWQGWSWGCQRRSAEVPRRFRFVLKDWFCWSIVREAYRKSQISTMVCLGIVDWYTISIPYLSICYLDLRQPWSFRSDLIGCIQAKCFMKTAVNLCSSQRLFTGWYWKKKITFPGKKITFPGKNIYSPWKRNLGSSGRVVLWSCGPGPLVLWSCGPLVLWSSGRLVVWSSDPVVLWSCGPLVLCSSGPLVLWSSGPLVLWSSGPVVLWSCGRVVLWPSGPVVPWQRREKKYVGTKNAWKECKRK